ncbi:YihY/virulence factor BrkB family protein [Halorubrum lipolyticum]|uniref:Ribonuclease BN n=1 Tax=Halorubrum lipolyticum DSM 21995 TaxID=1227482 RepID=M0NRV7_9EURY|nr:YihY/virulence factor BrkB family protein [Halorubrum lipolyticum]EMA59360.1 ribonuclease BN [Halorubrum lipolyticum DSM 21995]
MRPVETVRSLVALGRSTVAFGRSVFVLGRESELSFLAGSIAFFAFFSVVPALVLAVAVGSAVGGERFAAGVLALFEAYLSTEGTAVVSAALTDQSGIAGATAVGTLALAWSALKVFRAIDLAFDRIYGSETVTPLGRQLLNATAVMTTIGIGIVLLVSAQLVLGLPAVERVLPSRAVGIAVLFGGLLVALLPVYYVLPPRRVSLREVLPGTVAAVVGLVVLETLFHLYSTVAGQYRAYGFLGIVLLFLLWLYFGALALLFGAVVNVAVESIPAE